MTSYVIAGYTVYWRFPTEVERLAYVAKAVEVDRIAHQLSDNTIWMLVDADSVTWAKVGGGSVASEEFAGNPLVFYILAKT